MFQKNISQAVIPGKKLTIDEQLCAYRGKCPFRQYIPNKPAKYGIKNWELADSETGYLLKIEMYLGRGRNNESQINNRERNQDRLNE